MTMGKPQMHELQTDDQTCCSVRRDRRNAMWNIFEGVEAEVLQQVPGLSLGMVEQVVMVHSDAEDSDIEESPSSVPDSHHHPFCASRIHRSFSTTSAGDEVRAALQNRRRRNAVGNLFDLLSGSQKLLLVEHLQAEMERLQGDGLRSGSISSNSSSSSSSSPRSQGEIVCR